MRRAAKHFGLSEPFVLPGQEDSVCHVERPTYIVFSPSEWEGLSADDRCNFCMIWFNSRNYRVW